MTDTLIKKIKNTAHNLKIDLPAVFLSLQQKDTPWYAKCLGLIAVAYAFSPIDFIPDFIPILGYLDDLVLLPLLIGLTLKLIPESVLSRCRKQAENLWKDRVPKKWYCGIPIALFWLWIILLISGSVF